MVWTSLTTFLILFQFLKATHVRHNWNIRQPKVISASESNSNENDLEYYIEDNNVNQEIPGNNLINKDGITEVSHANFKEWKLNFIKNHPRRVINAPNSQQVGLKNNQNHAILPNGETVSVKDGSLLTSSQSNNKIINKHPNKKLHTEQSQNKNSLDPKSHHQVAEVKVPIDQPNLGIASSPENIKDFDYYEYLDNHATQPPNSPPQSNPNFQSDHIKGLKMHLTKKPPNLPNLSDSVTTEINSEYDYETESTTNRHMGIANTIKLATNELFSSVEPLTATTREPNLLNKGKHIFTNKANVTEIISTSSSVITEEYDYDYEEMKPIHHISTASNIKHSTFSNLEESGSTEKSITNKINPINKNKTPEEFSKGKYDINSNETRPDNRINSEEMYYYYEDTKIQSNSKSTNKQPSRNQILDVITSQKLTTAGLNHSITDDYNYYSDEHETVSISPTVIFTTKNNSATATSKMLPKKDKGTTKRLNKLSTTTSPISTENHYPIDNNKNSLDIESKEKNVEKSKHITTSETDLLKISSKTIDVSTTHKPIATTLISTSTIYNIIGSDSKTYLNNDAKINLSTSVSSSMQENSTLDTQFFNKNDTNKIKNHSSFTTGGYGDELEMQKIFLQGKNNVENQNTSESSKKKVLSLQKYTTKKVYGRTKINKRNRVHKTTSSLENTKASQSVVKLHMTSTSSNNPNIKDHTDFVSVTNVADNFPEVTTIASDNDLTTLVNEETTTFDDNDSNPSNELLTTTSEEMVTKFLTTELITEPTTELITESTTKDYTEEDYDEFIRSNPFNYSFEAFTTTPTSQNEENQTEETSTASETSESTTAIVTEEKDNDDDIEVKDKKTNAKEKSKKKLKKDKLSESHDKNNNQVSTEISTVKSQNNINNKVKYNPYKKTAASIEKKVTKLEITTESSKENVATLGSEKMQTTQKKKVKVTTSSSILSSDDEEDILDDSLASTSSNNNYDENTLTETTLQPKINESLLDYDNIETTNTVFLKPTKTTHSVSHSPLTTKISSKSLPIETKQLTTIKTKQNNQKATPQFPSTIKTKLPSEKENSKKGSTNKQELVFDATTNDIEESDVTTELSVTSKTVDVQIKTTSTKTSAKARGLKLTKTKDKLDVTKTSNIYNSDKIDLLESTTMNDAITESYKIQDKQYSSHLEQDIEGEKVLTSKIPKNINKKLHSFSSTKGTTKDTAVVSTTEENRETISLRSITENEDGLTTELGMSTSEKQIESTTPLQFSKSTQKESTTDIIVEENTEDYEIIESTSPSIQKITKQLNPNASKAEQKNKEEEKIYHKETSTVNLLNKSGPVWSKKQQNPKNNSKQSEMKFHKNKEEVEYYYKDDTPKCRGHRGIFNGGTPILTCDNRNVTFVSWKGFSTVDVNVCSSSEQSEDPILLTDLTSISSTCQVDNQSPKCEQRYILRRVIVEINSRKIRQCVKIPNQCSCQ